MDSFLNKYFELGISGVDLEICNDNKLELHKECEWHITGFVDKKDWAIIIRLDIDLLYEVRLDITRYVKRNMFVELNELQVLYSCEEFIELIKCVTDLKYLRQVLTKLLKGYIPIVCSDCFIMNWKRDQRDSYSFIMDILLKECFSGAWHERFKDTLKPLPGFITNIDSDMYTRIGSGLNLIREISFDGKSDVVSSSHDSSVAKYQQSSSKIRVWVCA